MFKITAKEKQFILKRRQVISKISKITKISKNKLPDGWYYLGEPYYSIVEYTNRGIGTHLKEVVVTLPKEDSSDHGKSIYVFLRGENNTSLDFKKFTDIKNANNYALELMNKNSI